MHRKLKFLLASVLGGVLVIGAGLSLLMSTLVGLPDFSVLKTSVELKVTSVTGREGIRRFGPATKEWISLQGISDFLIMAVISSEDASFYQHKGVDLAEVKEAIKKDIKEKRWARGASTITQQLVKNVFLSSEKTLTRKIREIVIARELEKYFSKSQILCFYLNVVEWGPGVYGIRHASEHYFSRLPSSLTAKEAAFLAMLLPSPIKYHVYFEKKELTYWASKRISHILLVMNKMGFLDELSYQHALLEPLFDANPKEWDIPGAQKLIPTDDLNLPSPDEEIEIPPDS